MGKEIENFLNNLIQNSNNSEIDIDGSDFMSSKIILGKDEKDAYIKSIADKYLSHQEIEGKDRAKELGITRKDVIAEIARREIFKLMGKD